MQRHFDQDLEQLREKLLRMAGVVESMIGACRSALRGGEHDRPALEAIFQNEHASNQMHRELSEAVVVLIARHQPVADDLRFLVSALQMVGHLERIGDLSVNLGRKVLDLLDVPDSPVLREKLSRMSEAVGAMVAHSVDAFVRQDVPLAESVLEQDDLADRGRDEVTRAVLEAIPKEPGRAVELIEILLAARNLERMADHATYIAGDAIYLAQGRDVRHQVGESHEKPGSWRQLRSIPN